MQHVVYHRIRSQNGSFSLVRAQSVLECDSVGRVTSAVYKLVPGLTLSRARKSSLSSSTPLPLSRPSVTHSNQHTWWLSVSVTVEEFDNELALNPSRVRPMMAALGDMYVDTYRHPPPPNACGSRPYTLGPRPYTLHPRP